MYTPHHSSIYLTEERASILPESVSAKFSHYNLIHLVIQRLLHRQMSRYTWNLLFIFSLASGLDMEGHMCDMGQPLAQWVGENFRKSLTAGDLATTSLYMQVTENHIYISHWTKLKVSLSLHPLSNIPKSSGHDKVTWPKAKSEREKAVLLNYCS